MHVDEKTIIDLLNDSGLVTKTDISVALKKSKETNQPWKSSGTTQSIRDIDSTRVGLGFRHLKRLTTTTTAKTALATVAPISLETALIYAIPDVTSTKPHNFFLLRNFLPRFKRIETHRCHNGLSGSRLKLRLFRSSEHLNRVHRETTL